jgi:hypothetical protein
VPMCQSPKIADALLRTQKVSANDNHVPIEKRIKPESESLFTTTCRACLIVCCAGAFLLL